MSEMHQLDRMEEMLLRMTSNIPGGDTHVLKRDVAITVSELLRYLREGRKIEAIKTHRWLTGMGLKESKDAIENTLSELSRQKVA